MNLSFCKSFDEPCQVKYILEDLDDIEPNLSPNVPHVNLLSILMVNSQKYYLPVVRKSSTR